MCQKRGDVSKAKSPASMTFRHGYVFAGSGGVEVDGVGYEDWIIGSYLILHCGGPGCGCGGCVCGVWGIHDLDVFGLGGRGSFSRLSLFVLNES